MKKLAFVSLISLSLSATASAAPQKCPDLNLIKSAGYSTEFESSFQGKNYYYAHQAQQKYDTPEVWSFHITGVEANNLQDARNKIKQAFATLAFKNGPNDYGAAWQCAYTTANNDDAEAVTSKE